MTILKARAKDKNKNPDKKPYVKQECAKNRVNYRQTGASGHSTASLSVCDGYTKGVLSESDKGIDCVIDFGKTPLPNDFTNHTLNITCSEEVDPQKALITQEKGTQGASDYTAVLHYPFAVNGQQQHLNFTFEGGDPTMGSVMNAIGGNHPQVVWGDAQNNLVTHSVTDGLSTGAKAGIAGGSVAGGLGLLAIAYKLYQNYQKKQKAQDPDIMMA